MSSDRPGWISKRILGIIRGMPENCCCRRFASTLLLVVLAGCGEPTRGRMSTPNASIGADSVPGRATVSSGVSIAAGGAPAESALAAAPHAQGLTFHVVAEFARVPNLFHLEGGLFIADHPTVLRINGDHLDRSEELNRGVPVKLGWTFDGFWTMSGTWPSNTLASAVFQSSETTEDRFLVHREGRWQPVFGRAAAQVSYATLWQSNRVLGLKHRPDTRMSLEFASDFIAWPPSPHLPRMTLAPVTPHPDDDVNICGWCRSAIIPAALATLSDGRVFVGGATCDKHYLAVEWWEPGETAGQIQVLNEAAVQGVDAAWIEVGPNEAYLSLGGYGGAILAHFSAGVWTKLDTPFSAHCASLDAVPDGSLFVVAYSGITDAALLSSKAPPSPEQFGELWRRSAEGHWTKLELPSDIPGWLDGYPPGVREVAVQNAEDVWVIAGRALLHSRPPVGRVQQFGL